LRPRKDVAAFAHGNGEADGRFSASEHGLRRIDIGPPDLGDVSEADETAVRGELATARMSSSATAGDAKRQLVAGLQRPAGLTAFCAQLRQARLIDARPASVSVENSMMIVSSWAPDLDLGHVGYAQQSCPDVLHIVAQLAGGRPVGRSRR
jgi:hypothetical protein